MTEPPPDMPTLPTESSLDRLVSLLEPFSRVIQPKLYGVDHLPADGSLLVGNHTIYGLLDVPFTIDRSGSIGDWRSASWRARPLRRADLARPAHRGRDGSRHP